MTTELQKLVVQFAREYPAWGCDRITGAPANLGHSICDQTVGNILKEHGLGPTGERKRHLTWAEFIRRLKEVLWATDFFSTEIWTQTGLTTFYALFFIQVQTRKVTLGGVTCAPAGEWMKQVARNVTGNGQMNFVRYLIRDRDGKYGSGFDAVFECIGIKPLKLPPQSPNLIAFAERWVRLVKEECLDQLILFCRPALRPTDCHARSSSRMSSLTTARFAAINNDWWRAE